MAGAPAFYLVPDGPGLAEAIRGTEAVPLESSRQMTNSWGLRGPEPEPRRPAPRAWCWAIRCMQGMFIGDGETPPDCLARYLQRTLEDARLDPQRGRDGLLARAILSLR